MMSDHLIRHTTLRQLQIFEASVRFGSFTRAAEALFLTQPTVSMQIKKLADTVGLPLFEQVGRKLRPTEAGTELYKSCRQIFATLSNLEMKMADLKGVKTGRLTLGVITTAKCFAPELLGEFCQLYPGIELSLKVTNRDSIIGRMHNNEDDLYIMGRAPSDEMEVLASLDGLVPSRQVAPNLEADIKEVGEKVGQRLVGLFFARHVAPGAHALPKGHVPVFDAQPLAIGRVGPGGNIAGCINVGIARFQQLVDDNGILLGLVQRSAVQEALGIAPHRRHH